VSDESTETVNDRFAHGETHSNLLDQGAGAAAVLALIKHLGIEAELIKLDVLAGALTAPDYVRLNPNMKVPTLVDGDLVLWEASAITAHLCIKAGSDM
jgi:glutathione S-transferase